MSEQISPIAVSAAQVAPRSKPSSYPEPYASRMTGREKRALGDVFGLLNFGVNLTRLAPGAQSALRHAHSKQDEFIYVLQGQPVLVTNAGESMLAPGMCAGSRQAMAMAIICLTAAIRKWCIWKSVTACPAIQLFIRMTICRPHSSTTNGYSPIKMARHTDKSDMINSNTPSTQDRTCHTC